jgi:hypothetical protein
LPRPRPGEIALELARHIRHEFATRFSEPRVRRARAKPDLTTALAG